MGVIYNYLVKNIPHKELGSPVVVNIQNVVDYVVSLDDVFVVEKDMNVAPPWNYALFEWDVEVTLVQSEHPGEYFTHHGLLVDYYRRDGGGWDFNAGLYFASSSDTIYEYFRYDGIIEADGTPGKMYSENGVSFQNNEAVINVSTGEAVDLSSADPHDPNLTGFAEDLPAIRYSYLRMVFFALTFANCHNVKVRDNVPVLTRQMRRHGGQPIVYKTLDIPGFSVERTSRENSTSPRDGTPRRFHVCRGHFAHHENLFGRLGPRTVWVPAHVKGDASTGVVVKDYRMAP